jgi:hypothetical protein
MGEEGACSEGAYPLEDSQGRIACQDACLGVARVPSSISFLFFFLLDYSSEESPQIGEFYTPLSFRYVFFQKNVCAPRWAFRRIIEEKCQPCRGLSRSHTPPL